MRALEKAAAADSCRVAQVPPPSGGSSILTEDSVEPQPHAASTTASIVSHVSEQVEESMRCSYGACMFPMCALQTCQHCNDGVVHRLCVPQMMKNRLWCAECCRSEEVGDANADSDTLDLFAWVSATTTLNYDNDKHVGSDLTTEVVPSHDTDFHTQSSCPTPISI